MNEIHVHPKLELTPTELTSTLDALRSALAHRVFWTLSGRVWWRENDFEDCKIVIDTLANSYAKAMMLCREIEVAESFIETFTLSDAVWESINQISLSKSWSDIKTHKEDFCPVCVELMSIA